MRNRFFALTLLAAWAAGLLAVPVAAVAEPATRPSAPRPNVVVIMADDLGYADLGCYGSEIQTPNLDALAQGGVRFSHFRVEPMCTVSRVALMAGMPFNLADNGKYTRAVPFPRLLRDAGYTTGFNGKWHAGAPDPRDAKLFDQSYGFLGGMTDSFAGGDDWFDGKNRIVDFPEGFYSTHALTAKAIHFIERAARDSKPFFLFLSFNAPHHPVQAPQATVKKYARAYDTGYDAVRAARHRRQIEMGLVDKTWPDAPADAGVRRWSDLTPHRQRVEADRMAAYAAAVDEIDQQVGKLRQTLAEKKLDRNTVIVFLSDNGADYNNGSPRTDQQQIPWQPGSNVTSGNEWARVKNTPFRSYKHSCFEGALASPLIVHWPDGLKRDPGAVIHEPAHVTDLYPTMIELAGVNYPADIDGKSLRPLTGRSLAPLFVPDGKLPANGVFSWYDFSASWHDGDWKITRLYDGPWMLFNLRDDRGEARDLAESEPGRVNALAHAFDAFAEGTGVRTVRPPVPQRGWGWHRVQMITSSQVKAMTPQNGAIIDTLMPDVSITFNAPLLLARDGRTGVRVYRVDDEETPIWERPAAELTLQDDGRTLVLDALPPLKADTSYFVEWTPGFATINGKPVGPLNDGAYWWRFRTAAKPR